MEPGHLLFSMMQFYPASLIRTPFLDKLPTMGGASVVPIATPFILQPPRTHHHRRCHDCYCHHGRHRRRHHRRRRDLQEEIQKLALLLGEFESDAHLGCDYSPGILAAGQAEEKPSPAEQVEWDFRFAMMRSLAKDYYSSRNYSLWRLLASAEPSGGASST